MTAQHLGTGWGVSEEDRWAKGTGGRSRDNWNPVRPAVTTVTAMLTETGLCWSFYLHNYFVEQDSLCAMSPQLLCSDCSQGHCFMERSGAAGASLSWQRWEDRREEGEGLSSAHRGRWEARTWAMDPGVSKQGLESPCIQSVGIYLSTWGPTVLVSLPLPLPT